MSSTVSPLDFARRHLAPYKVKGGEIVPELCPFCHGGAHRDKETFALNVDTGAYNCRRGSCRAQGSFRQLCREFGEEMEQYENKRVRVYPAVEKIYKRPETKPRPITDQAAEYLTGRGISREVVERYRVGTDEKGNILFPFYDETGALVYVKHRPIKGEGPKEWQDKETKPILFGMNLCDPAAPLTIFEGEIDALSGATAGIPNAVSVPSGCQNFDWLETCWEFIEQFDDVFLYGDNDEPGREMIDTLSRRLMNRGIYIAQHKRKDANEELTQDGAKTVYSAWENAKPAPLWGLVDVGTIKPLDFSKISPVLSGFASLDYAIGGFFPGDVTVWTAKRGSGKSTLVSQLVLDAIDTGEKVFLFSGELEKDVVVNWLDAQAAGGKNIERVIMKGSGKPVFQAKQAVADEINHWIEGKMYLHERARSSTASASELLEAAVIAARRCGCTVFVIDNLMAVGMEVANERDRYLAQSRFAGQLVDFANHEGVIVHLVAHPRKLGEGKNAPTDADEVAGSSDITNRVSNVISLEKLDSDRATEEGRNAILRVLKNRLFGADATISLIFDEETRRLCEVGSPAKKAYGWQRDPLTDDQEVLPW